MMKVDQMPIAIQKHATAMVALRTWPAKAKLKVALVNYEEVPIFMPSHLEVQFDSRARVPWV